MMRSRVLALAALLLVVTGAQAADLGGFDMGQVGKLLSKAREATRTVKEPEEIELGSGIASTLLGAAPLVHRPELQRYVNRVGMWIAMQSERPGLPWHFAVIDTDDINAFAAPGGYVFITKGLFLSLRDEAELAGVLAHEIGHVLRRHHLKAIQKNAQMGMAEEVGKMVAQKSGRDISALVSTGMELYARGLDKADELEADRIGVVLAARAGYYPYGLLGVLKTLDNLGPADDALTLMFKTHPPPAERIATLRAAMQGQFEEMEDLPRLGDRLLKEQQLALGP